jgi:hypothetical protein
VISDMRSAARQRTSPLIEQRTLALHLAVIISLALSAIVCSIPGLPRRPDVDGTASESGAPTVDLPTSTDHADGSGTGGFDARVVNGGAGGTTTSAVDAPISGGGIVGTGGFLGGMHCAFRHSPHAFSSRDPAGRGHRSFRRCYNGGALTR